MRIEAIPMQPIKPGETVRVPLAGGAVVEGKVRSTVGPAQPGDEYVCIVDVQLPLLLSDLRRTEQG